MGFKSILGAIGKGALAAGGGLLSGHPVGAAVEVVVDLVERIIPEKGAGQRKKILALSMLEALLQGLSVDDLEAFGIYDSGALTRGLVGLIDATVAAKKALAEIDKATTWGDGVAEGVE
jgi:hypothetical protein